MNDAGVRVRFAPSPTGGLHLGGVRTVLYNYLFARHHGGQFILRIEDTDSARFVPGAEEYIYETLRWCGLEPDESPVHGGKYGPYRQSERKEIYLEYAKKLVDAGQAYYAFDTSEELDAMRKRRQDAGEAAAQYDRTVRGEMRNSLSLSPTEVETLMANGTPYVVRIRMPEGETISFTDAIRGGVSFESSLVDDKVLLKRDGMPTYHLAVVVDDYLMKITHAFRGEEWLPSAPVHILLWRYLFGQEAMPQWAHLPLILGPAGKLSKRDGAKYGFPVYAAAWADRATGETTEGFREKGFLPEAFINLLALLGWNDGSEQEIFSLQELVQRFDLAGVHSAGARFDYEKAKWYNAEWIKRTPAEALLPAVKDLFASKGVDSRDDATLQKRIDTVKERCVLLPDFWTQASFFYQAPETIDAESVKAKWTEGKTAFFRALLAEWKSLPMPESAFLEDAFKTTAAVCGIKPGEVQLPLRIALVGGKFGPPVFDIVEALGVEETARRVEAALPQFGGT